MLRFQASKKNCETFFSFFFFFEIFLSKNAILGLIRLVFEANQETPARNVKNVRTATTPTTKIAPSVPDLGLSRHRMYRQSSSQLHDPTRRRHESHKTITELQ